MTEMTKRSCRWSAAGQQCSRTGSPREYCVENRLDYDEHREQFDRNRLSILPSHEDEAAAKEDSRKTSQDGARARPVHRVVDVLQVQGHRHEDKTGQCRGTATHHDEVVAPDRWVVHPLAANGHWQCLCDMHPGPGQQRRRYVADWRYDIASTWVGGRAGRDGKEERRAGGATGRIAAIRPTNTPSDDTADGGALLLADYGVRLRPVANENCHIARPLGILAEFRRLR